MEIESSFTESAMHGLEWSNQNYFLFLCYLMTSFAFPIPHILQVARKTFSLSFGLSLSVFFPPILSALVVWSLDVSPSKHKQSLHLHWWCGNRIRLPVMCDCCRGRDGPRALTCAPHWHTGMGECKMMKLIGGSEEIKAILPLA